MQKQQDMGKAHWLSNPPLVGGWSLYTPGTTGPQRRGSSACTLTLRPPRKTQLKSPWGRRCNRCIVVDLCCNCEACSLDAPGVVTPDTAPDISEPT